MHFHSTRPVPGCTVQKSTLSYFFDKGQCTIVWGGLNASTSPEVGGSIHRLLLALRAALPRARAFFV